MADVSPDVTLPAVCRGLRVPTTYNKATTTSQKRHAQRVRKVGAAAAGQWTGHDIVAIHKKQLLSGFAGTAAAPAHLRQRDHIFSKYDSTKKEATILQQVQQQSHGPQGAAAARAPTVPSVQVLPPVTADAACQTLTASAPSSDQDQLLQVVSVLSRQHCLLVRTIVDAQLASRGTGKGVGKCCGCLQVCRNCICERTARDSDDDL